MNRNFVLRTLFEVQGNKEREKEKKMIKFKQQEKKPAVITPISDKVVDTTAVRSIKLGVFHNEDHLTAQIEFGFDVEQQGWQTDTVKLTNNLSKLNNIAYKMPADFDWAKKWYDGVIGKCREFKKYTGSDYHTKLGYRFHSRYHTIPFTWFSYDPVTHLGLLQVSIPEERPDGSIDFFKNHVELQLTLDTKGAKDLQYTWAGKDE